MPIDEKQLLDAMDQYGDVRHKLEGLKSERQTVIDRILERYPEVRLEIQDAEEELDGQIKNADKVESQLKKTLQAMIDQFAANAPIKDKMELKSPLLRVGLTKKVTYDSVALDGMAVENPKLLAFRKEEISSRITLNKL